MRLGWRLGVGGLALAAGLLALACEDARPAAAPAVHGEREALAQRWTDLAARLEGDNEMRVRARLSPDARAKLDVAVVRASSRLHEARRALENAALGMPDQARAELVDRARGVLDDAEKSVSEADALRASTEVVDAGPPPAPPLVAQDG